jgi:hypothetical protein
MAPGSRATPAVLNSVCAKPTSVGPAPMALQALSGNLNGAALTWQPVPGAVAYVVDRKDMTNNGPWVPIGSNCPGAPNDIVITGSAAVAPLRANSAGILDTTGIADTTDASYGTIYKYRVQAISASGAMGWNTVSWTKTKKFQIVVDSLDVAGSTLSLRAYSYTLPEYALPTKYVVTYSYGGGQPNVTNSATSQRAIVVIPSVPAGPQSYTITGLWNYYWNGANVPIARYTVVKNITITP